LIELDLGVAGFYYLLQDHRREVEELLAAMHAARLQEYGIVARCSPAPALIQAWPIVLGVKLVHIVEYSLLALLLIWGWDPVVTVLGSHTTWALREAKRQGIPIIVVDPRRTATAAYADRWIPIRPGSDVALLNALTYELVRNGRHDEAFLRQHTVGWEAYLAYLHGRSLLGRFTVAESDAAVPYFEKATTLDPHFAAAFASLYDAHLQAAERRREDHDGPGWTRGRPADAVAVRHH
jgi:hypothetical protein